MANTIRSLPTGSARAVTDSVERMQTILHGRPEWSPKPAPARSSGRRTWKQEPEPKLLDAEDSGPESAPEAEADEDAGAQDQNAGE
jgi:hypothetical protein